LGFVLKKKKMSTSVDGFEKANSNNLPTLDIFMLTNFLVSKFLRSCRILPSKVEKVNFLSFVFAVANIFCFIFRSGRLNYGEDAVGHVQVKRQGNVCSVKARVTPEHKIRQTPYQVTTTINTFKEEIRSASCDGCAASEG